jgi:hypothetical protein
MSNIKTDLKQQEGILQRFSLNWTPETNMRSRQSSSRNVFVCRKERLMWKNIARLSVFFLLIGILFWPERANAEQDLALRDCASWCVETSNCVACSTLSGCGSYYTDINTFRRGSGKVWYACRARNSKNGRRSEGERRECIQYCRENWEYCDMCSTYKNCGQDYDRLKSFTGKGRNWFACQNDRVNDSRHPKSIDNPDLYRIFHGTVSMPGW